MDKDYIIREATLNDLAVLKDFEQEIIAAERPMDPTLKPGKISYYDLAEYIEDKNKCVLVAESNGELIASGYAIPKTARHYLNHDTYAYLGFMYTVPQWRGKGVNKAIVEGLKKWSKAAGYTELRLTVYNVNEGAIRAYEKAGFKRHFIEMRLG
ncbi:MAG: GNAT family N-acetyltransferase [Bacteroidota bacterium]